MRKFTGQHKYMNDQKGFTLVELIVVLAILSILASVAVFSIIGYIDKSRFDNNEQNAQSIYQAVQTAIGRKKNTGDIEEWIENTLMKKGQEDPCDTGAHPNNDRDASGNILDDCFNATAFDNFDENHNSIGDSVHMRYILTYQKGGNSEDNAMIMDLVGGYFYDTSILNATFTIEFDVEKTIGGDRQVHYGVNTYAVFYDEKRADWDEKALKESGNVVPWREYAYRSDTSLVGYFNGGNPTAVDSVYTPIVNKKMEFAELAMRNGEKLELSFSVMYDGKNVTGMGAGEGTDNYVHYTASLYDTSDDRWLADLVISEAYLTTGKPNGNQPVDYRSDLKFAPNSYGNGSVVYKNVGGKDLPVLYTTDYMVDDTNAHFVRYKASVETTALVYVNTKGHNDFDYNLLTANDLTDGKFYRFPLTISYIIREYSETDRREYVSYSIALDAMMSRQAEFQKNNNDKYLNYSIARLFMDKTSPKNIRVSMTAEVDDFTDSDLAKYNFTENLPASESKNAKRAYDDPVYFVEDGKYVYKDPNKCDPEECATRDVVGYAVCNTFFGDLGYGSFGDKNDYVDIQENGKENRQQIASITSFRHLYNMRYTTGCKFENSGEVKPVVYEIQRDLDWYRKTDDGFTSEVEVYGITNNYLTGFSSVGNYRGFCDPAQLKVVSWPALPELSANQVLIAKDNALSTADNDKSAIIRNVQMRSKSFTTTDEGFGFICKNEGTLCNIRCENFCLTLENIADGTTEPNGKSVAETLAHLFQHGSDEKDSFLETSACILADGNDPYNHYVPIGSLVGLQNGKLGIEDAGLLKEENTIKVSNPIVLAGLWDANSNPNIWKKVRMYNHKDSTNLNQVAGIGGIIGYYSDNAYSCGYIETNGNFAVAGAYYIGGVIGKVQGGVDACIIVDSKTQIAGNVIVLPTNVNCLVMGRNCVGGAVGYAVNGYFAQVTPNYTDDNIVEKISEQSDASYGISATLAANSYVWQYAGWDGESYDGIGGAVGQIYGHDPNKVLTIKSINEGYILNTKVGKAKGRYLGGAVGYIQQGSAKEIYICAENSGQIGTKEANVDDDAQLSVFGKGYAAAAGVAYINNFGTNGAFYRFDVLNSGYICCKSDGEDIGTGAGTAIGVYQSSSDGYPKLQINAVNSGIIKVENTVSRNDKYWNGNQDYSFGAGGAAGYLYGMQSGSYINCVLKKDAVVVSAGSNVGGAVGCIRNELKGTAVGPITINSSLDTGVQIKSKGLNVGGCIGNMRAQSDYCSVATQVNGNASVYGYMNVGGVVGCGQQKGHGAANVVNANIQLQGMAVDNVTPVLSVKGAENYTTVKATNKNIGGVAGIVGTYNGVYSTKIQSSIQNGTDKLGLAIDGGECIGGLIGGFYLNDLCGAGQHYGTAPIDYALELHPQTKIIGLGKYVGGAIGYVYDQNDGNSSSADFAVNLSVKIPAGTTGNVVKGTNYIGGVIGAVNAPNMTGTVNGEIGASDAINGTAMVGGVIGYTIIQTAAGDINATISASNAVTASGTIQMKTNGAKGAFVGGCIGLVDGTAAYGNIAASYSGTADTSISPIYGTSNYMGGCIGCIGGDDLSPSVLSASTVIKGKTQLITAPENSISDIGGVVGLVRKGSTVTKISLIQPKDENDNIIAGDMSLNLPKANFVGGVVGRIYENCRIGQITGEVPVTIQAHASVGGLVGRVFDTVGIKEISDEIVSVGQTEPVGLIGLTGGYSVDISAYSNVGGYIGSAQNAMFGTPVGDAQIKVSASDKAVGGFFGAIDNVTIGTKNREVTSTNIQYVTAAAAGSRATNKANPTFDQICGDIGGTGGFIGMMLNKSEVNCRVRIDLGTSTKIIGGWNTGGIIGYIGEGYLNGDLTVNLIGGQVQGRKGCVGGLIGSFQQGAADIDSTTEELKLSVNVTGYYSNLDRYSTAIGGDGTEKGYGGIIGQIGGGDGSETAENRKTVVKLGTLVLGIGGDCNEFVIKSGTSSVGGVIGQCETENGIIKKMKIISIDNQPCSVRVLSDAFDVGGFAGYFFGKLTEELRVGENIEIEVLGKAYVGGCFGGMDGSLDATMTIRGIRSVEGTGTYTNTFKENGVDKKVTVSGVGGVIGAIGVWHGTGYIGERLEADLTGTHITGKSATGGVIGCVGIRSGEHDAIFGTAFRAEVKATFSNTIVDGTEYVGGLFGYIKEKFNWDDDSTMKLIVEEDSTVKARENGKSVGGMVGYNDAAFGSITVLNIAGGKTLTVFAQNGYAGGVIGTNNRVFSNKRTGTVEYPSGNGKLVIDVNNSRSGYVGAIIGHNTSNAISGRVKVDGDEVVRLDDMDNAKYDSDAELRGRYDKTSPYAGFIGMNEEKGEIYKVEMVGAELVGDGVDAGESNSTPASDQSLTDDEWIEMDSEDDFPSMKTDEEMFEEEMPAVDEQRTNQTDDVEEPESDEDEESQTESNDPDENRDELNVPEKEDFEEDISENYSEPAA